jgi:hypothetical protein
MIWPLHYPAVNPQIPPIHPFTRMPFTCQQALILLASQQAAILLACSPPTMAALMVISQWYNILLLEQDGSNFSVWHFHICVILRSYKLLTVLNDTHPNPILYPAKSTTWDEKDQQAFSLIALLLTREPMHLIFHAQTAKKCLDCLSVF